MPGIPTLVSKGVPISVRHVEKLTLKTPPFSLKTLTFACQKTILFYKKSYIWDKGPMLRVIPPIVYKGIIHFIISGAINILITWDTKI